MLTWKLKEKKKKKPKTSHRAYVIGLVRGIVPVDRFKFVALVSRLNHRIEKNLVSNVVLALLSLSQLAPPPKHYNQKSKNASSLQVCQLRFVITTVYTTIQTSINALMLYLMLSLRYLYIAPLIVCLRKHQIHRRPVMIRPRLEYKSNIHLLFRQIPTRA